MQRSVLAAWVLVSACAGAPAPISRPGAACELHYTNALGGAFVLRRVTWSLDGVVVVDTTDAGELAAAGERSHAEVSLSSGSHHLVVDAEYEGSGYGIFSYLSGYRFHAHGELDLVATTAGPSVLHCTGFEQPDVIPEDRPRVRCVARP